MTAKQEWDWPPERRRLPTEYVTDVQPRRRAPAPKRNEIKPLKTDWASSPITTKIADAYFGFILFVLKMALAAVLGVVRLGLALFSIRVVDALILGSSSLARSLAAMEE
jgi:hypothetical protein